jgi:hypothetical protein
VDVEGALCRARTHTHLPPIVQGIVQSWTKNSTRQHDPEVR